MIFTAPEVSRIRQGKQCCTLVPRSETVTAGRVRPLRRLVVVLDGEGDPTGERRREVVREPTKDGEWRTVNLTVNSTAIVVLVEATLPQARACGFRTTSDLQADWRGKHPTMDLAQIVCFGLGDQRDLPRYLSVTGTAGGDYTANRHRSSDPDCEALSEEQLDELAAYAGQRQAKRTHQAAQAAAAPSLAARMARIERARERIVTDLSHELRTISRQIVLAER